MYMRTQEYVVRVQDGFSLSELDDALRNDGGSETIPHRAVQCANARELNTRQTNWHLTLEEAKTLKNDERVASVMLCTQDKPTFTTLPYKVKKGYAWQDSSVRSELEGKVDLVNSGLFVHSNTHEHQQYTPSYFNRVRHDTLVDVNGVSHNIDGNAKNGSDYHRYKYTGKGVDVVIMDTGIQVDHPEWDDEFGRSRLKTIDWFAETGISGSLPSDFYTDNSSYAGGHGTHVASIAAGKKHGWAKDADIYVMNVDKIDMSTAFDLLEAWHTQKTNGRPTVVNMSFALQRTYKAPIHECVIQGQTFDAPWKTESSWVDNKLTLPLADYDLSYLREGTAYADMDKANKIRTSLSWWSRYAAHNYFGTPQGKQTYHYFWNPNTGLNGDIYYNFDVYNEVQPDGSLFADDIKQATQDLIDAGIHCIIAAGNERTLQDVETPDKYNSDYVAELGTSAGQNWNNTASFLIDEDGHWTLDETSEVDDGNGGTVTRDNKKTCYIHRPPAPWANDAINVGSINDDFYIEDYSNFGAAIDIWACGGDIVAALPTDQPITNKTFPYELDAEKYPIESKEKYKAGILSGTSMASPQVAGVACLYLERDPSLTPQELKKLMVKDGNKSGTNKREGSYDNYADYLDTMNGVNGLTTINSWEIPVIRPHNNYWDIFAHRSNAVNTLDKPSTRCTLVAPEVGENSLTIKANKQVDVNATNALRNVTGETVYQYPTAATTITSKDYLQNALITVDDIDAADAVITLQIQDSLGNAIPLQGLPSISFEATTGTLGDEVSDNGDGSYSVAFTPLADGTETTITAYSGNSVFLRTFTYGLSNPVVNFTSPLNAQDISEEVGNNTVVYTATTDYGTVYDLGQQHDSSMFTIQTVNNTGVVTLTNAPDYTTKNEYKFEVRARIASGQLYKTQIVTLKVLDKDTPVIDFQANSLIQEITSGVLNDEDVTLAVDEDVAANALLGTYNITDDTNTTFEILDPVPKDLYLDENTLELRVGAEGFNYQRHTNYSFRIRVKDSYNNTKIFLTTINVNDIDLEPPVFANDGQGVNIIEGQRVGDTVYTLNVNENATFSIQSGGVHDSHFSLVTVPSDAKKVYLRLDSAIAYDAANDEARVIVRAADSLGNYNDLTVRFTIEELTPVINADPFAPDLPENAPANSIVWTGTVENGYDVTWSLMYSSDASTFTMDANTGELRLINAPDYATQDYYSVYVKASSPSGANDVVLVRFNVLDETKPTWSFTPLSGGNYLVSHTIDGDTLNITVNTTGAITTGAVLGQVTVSDASSVDSYETGDWGDFSADIGTITGNFNIEADNATPFQQDGTFTVNAAIFDEALNSRNITINITIVTPDLDAPTITSSDVASVTLTENVAANNDLIHTLVADEPCTFGFTHPNNRMANNMTATITYRGIDWTMNQSTGQIYATQGSANYEDGSVIFLHVGAEDSSGNRVLGQVAITVVNVLDTPPSVVYDGTLAIVNMLESATPNDLIATWYTDTSTSCTFQMKNVVGGYENLYRIETSTVGQRVYGKLYQKNNYSYDYEGTTIRHHPIKIECVDNRFSGDNTTESPLTVFYSNVDDESPEFNVSNSHIQWNVPLTAGSTILDVSTLVSDPDGSISNPLVYSITSSYPAVNYYSIDSATGVITNGYTLNTAGADVPITVKVTDQAGNDAEYTFTTEGVAQAVWNTTQTNGMSYYYGYSHIGFKNYGIPQFGTLTSGQGWYTLQSPSIHELYHYNNAYVYFTMAAYDLQSSGANSGWQKMIVNNNGVQTTFLRSNASIVGTWVSAGKRYVRWRWSASSNPFGGNGAVAQVSWEN